MSDSMANISVNGNDDSFDIAQQLLEFNYGDYANTANWVETLKSIRQKLTNRCYELADNLDASVAEHAKELEDCRKKYQLDLEELAENIALCENRNAQLTSENQTLKESLDRAKQLLACISVESSKVIEIVNDDEVISVESNDVGDDNDRENNNNGDRDRDCDGDGDVDGDGGKANGHDDTNEMNDENGNGREEGEQADEPNEDNDGDAEAEAERSDAGQDEPTEMQMETDVECDAGGPGDTKNVQSKVAARSTAPLTLQPAPIQQGVMASSATNRATKCFMCNAKFVQESAFVSHVQSFHGYTIQKENADEESGKFVRNPKKRKRLSATGKQANDDDNHAKRLKAKKVLKPAN